MAVAQHGDSAAWSVKCSSSRPLFSVDQFGDRPLRPYYPLLEVSWSPSIAVTYWRPTPHDTEGSSGPKRSSDLPAGCQPGPGIVFGQAIGCSATRDASAAIEQANRHRPSLLIGGAGRNNRTTARGTFERTTDLQETTWAGAGRTCWRGWSFDATGITEPAGPQGCTSSYSGACAISRPPVGRVGCYGTPEAAASTNERIAQRALEATTAG